MRAGYSRAEAGAVPLWRLRRVLQSIRLAELDELRMKMIVARAAVVNAEAYDEMMKAIDRMETYAGRPLPSAEEVAVTPQERRRIAELKAQLKAKRKQA